MRSSGSNATSWGTPRCERPPATTNSGPFGLNGRFRRAGNGRSDVQSGVTTAPLSLRSLTAAVCARALDARDARFDGVFFVGITTTRIYCRPVCPARISYPERRRFFDSAPAAEQAGYRPCLRCRPELAPGRAIIDAVPRLAQVA